MTDRWRRAALVLLLAGAAGCSPGGGRGPGPTAATGTPPADPSPSATATRSPSPSPSPSPAPSRTATRPPSPAPPSPAARPPAASAPLSLVYQRGAAVYALALHGSAPRPAKLLDVAGEVLLDQRGRYLAVREPRQVTFVALRTRRVVASVAGGDTAAFARDDTAIVTVRPTPPAHEHDCHRPTRIVRVDLRTGAQRTLLELDDQFVPDSVVGDVVVGSVVLDEECDTPAAALLDLTTGRLRQIGGGASVLQSVSPAGDRIWVSRYPDRAHPHGSQLVMDGAGRELARLPHGGYAVFGPGNAVAYTENTYGEPGTDDYYVAQRTTLRLGRGRPAAGDRGVSLPGQDGSLFWGSEGDTFVTRVGTPSDGETTGLRAVACTTRLVCRRLDLTWYDEVTLLGVVASARLR